MTKLSDIVQANQTTTLFYEISPQTILDSTNVELIPVPEAGKYIELKNIVLTKEASTRIYPNTGSNVIAFDDQPIQDGYSGIVPSSFLNTLFSSVEIKKYFIDYFFYEINNKPLNFINNSPYVRGYNVDYKTTAPDYSSALAVQIIVDSAGIPYLGVKNNYGVDIYKKENDTWIQLGSRFDMGQYFYLCVDTNDILYLCYSNSQSYVFLYKYINSNWEQVGTTITDTNNTATYLSLALDANDTPYIAFNTTWLSTDGIGVRLVKYDGGWVEENKFLINDVQKTKIVIKDTDIYVTYLSLNPNTVTINLYSAGVWSVVEGKTCINYDFEVYNNYLYLSCLESPSLVKVYRKTGVASWEQLGADITGYGSVDLYAGDSLILATKKLENSNYKIVIYKYTSGSWVQEGPTFGPINTNDTYAVSLAVTSTGDPYITISISDFELGVLKDTATYVYPAMPTASELGSLKIKIEYSVKDLTIEPKLSLIAADEQKIINADSQITISATNNGTL